MENRDIKIEEVGEVLNKIYDCEIHFNLEWIWDGGIDINVQKTYSENETNNYGDRNIDTGSNKSEVALTQIRDYIIEKNISKEFTDWCEKKFGGIENGK